MTLTKSTSKVAEGDVDAPSENITTKANKNKNKNQNASSRDNNESNDGDPFMMDMPRRVSFGKPSVPHQQLLFFVGIIAVLLNVALKMGSMIQIDPNVKYQPFTVSKPKQSLQRIENMRRYIRETIETAVLENPQIFGKLAPGMYNRADDDDPCGVFIDDSSIPETGWGWFAGKDYTAGEVIRREKGYSLSIPPVFGSRDASETTAHHGGGIAPLRLLMKPHPILSNVRWDDERDSNSLLSQDHKPGDWTASVLTATRDIREGEELFLSLEDHPFVASKASRHDTDTFYGNFDDVFSKILPTFEHFERADKLIREARIQYFGAINYTKLEIDRSKEKEPVAPFSSNARWNRSRRKPKTKSSASQQLYKPESAGDIENGLKLWQSAVAIHDPLVAKLLPTKVRSLAMYHRKAEEDESLISSSSSLGSLRNQTIWSLADTSSCVSAFEWQLVEPEDSPTTEESCQTPTDLQNEKSCSSRSSYQQVVARKRGFAKGEVVRIVPLLVLPHSRPEEPTAVSMPINGACRTVKFSSSTLELISCPLGGIYERTNDPSIANVEYKWSNRTMDQISAKVKSPVTSSMSLSAEEEQHLKDIFLEVRHVVQPKISSCQTTILPVFTSSLCHRFTLIVGNASDRGFLND